MSYYVLYFLFPLSTPHFFSIFSPFSFYCYGYILVICFFFSLLQFSQFYNFPNFKFSANFPTPATRPLHTRHLTLLSALLSSPALLLPQSPLFPFFRNFLPRPYPLTLFLYFDFYLDYRMISFYLFTIGERLVDSISHYIPFPLFSGVSL